jgi:fumarate reductase flavoprotein subunit
MTDSRRVVGTDRASPDYALDVAIVGAGACGLVAALRASRNRSLEVGIFEKNSHLLSNSEISGGTLAAAGTEFQRAAGIDDDPEQHATDIIRKNGGDCDSALVHALCRLAPSYVDWLATDLRFPIALFPEMSRVGHSAPRLHTDAERSGGATLMRHLRRCVSAASNVYMVDGTPGVGLEARDTGVDGIRIVENGQERRVAASATVLACDGFGADREMVRRHCGAIADAEYVGADGNTGDGIRWAVGLGAATARLSSYQAHGFVVYGYGTRLDPAIPLHGGIVVDESGRRFVREDQGYSEFADHVLALPEGRALEIWDERIMALVADSDLMRQSREAGAVRRFGDASDLARWAQLPEKELAATLTSYEEAVRNGEDEFGRVLPPVALGRPLYAAWITGALAHTQGGLVVDAQGRVAARSGGIIDGLYAGGGTAAGISGDSSHGYLSGNGLLTAVGLGFSIGDHLADSLR